MVKTGENADGRGDERDALEPGRRGMQRHGDHIEVQLTSLHRGLDVGRRALANGEPQPRPVFTQVADDLRADLGRGGARARVARVRLVVAARPRRRRLR
jgi:hypothetical protein